MIRFAVLLVATLLSASLQAEDKQHHLFWEPDHLLRVDWSGPWSMVARKGGAKVRAGTIQFPGVAAKPHFVDGAFFVTVPFNEPESGAKNGARGLKLLTSPDGRTWEEWARYPLRPGSPRATALLNLGNDRVALIAAVADFSAGEGRLSKLAVGRRKQRSGGSEIEIERVLDMGLPDALARKSGLGGAFGFLFVPWVVQIPGGFALVHPQTGYLWTLFREGEGVKVRTARLYGWMEDLLLKGQAHETVVLDVQPTSEGTLLFAARTEGGVLATTAQREETHKSRPVPKGMALDEAAQAAAERAQLFQAQGDDQRLAHWRNYPQLKWFRVDPGTGQVHETNPSGAPSSLPAKPPFSFTMTLKGQVVAGGAQILDDSAKPTARGSGSKTTVR